MSIRLIRADQLDTRSWGISTFWYVSVPLVIRALILPFVVGTALRGILQFAHKHPLGGRVMSMPFSAFFALLSMGVSLYPAHRAFVMYHRLLAQHLMGTD